MNLNESMTCNNKRYLNRLFGHHRGAHVMVYIQIVHFKKYITRVDAAQMLCCCVAADCLALFISRKK